MDNEWLAFLPTAIGTITAMSIALGYDTMNPSGWIAITAALIGVFGTLIACFFQLRRDGKTIDNTGQNTTEMKPKVETISEDTKKIRDVVLEQLKPTLTSVAEKNSKIDFISSEMEYQKRLQEKVSKDLENQDLIVLSIKALYEKNATLTEEVTKLRVENTLLAKENNSLKKENEEYRSQDTEHLSRDNSYRFR